MSTSTARQLSGHYSKLFNREIRLAGSGFELLCRPRIDLRLSEAGGKATLELVLTVPLAIARSGHSPEVIEFNEGSIDAWTEAVERQPRAAPKAEGVRRS
jgi:hypothetical protein